MLDLVWIIPGVAAFLVCCLDQLYYGGTSHILEEDPFA